MKTMAAAEGMEQVTGTETGTGTGTEETEAEETGAAATKDLVK
jgi:hypothetical protein